MSRPASDYVQELLHGGRPLSSVLSEGRYSGPVDTWTDLASVARTFARLGAIADRLRVEQEMRQVDPDGGGGCGEGNVFTDYRANEKMLEDAVFCAEYGASLDPPASPLQISRSRTRRNPCCEARTHLLLVPSSAVSFPPCRPYGNVGPD
jgi:hypothetical protein